MGGYLVRFPDPLVYSWGTWLVDTWIVFRINTFFHLTICLGNISHSLLLALNECKYYEWHCDLHLWMRTVYISPPMCISSEQCITTVRCTMMMHRGEPDFMRPSLWPVDPPWDYPLIIMHFCNTWEDVSLDLHNSGHSMSPELKMKG